MRIELYNTLEQAPGNDPSANFMPYLDTFLCPGATTPLGAVLVLPGGGYSHRAPHEGNPVAEAFNALGFHAFVLQYRVKPYGYPAPQRDAVRAMKIIRSRAAQWRVVPDKIAIAGFSAGGHLAACTGIMPEKNDIPCGDEADGFSGKPDAMILCYSVLSVKKTYGRLPSGIPVSSPYCDENGEAIELYQMVDENTPPAYIWHSADDPVVPAECSIRFAEAMYNYQKSCNLHIFPHAPHGRGLALGHPDMESWPVEAAEFLQLWCGFPGAIK